jgi:hypothetical protein
MAEPEAQRSGRPGERRCHDGVTCTTPDLFSPAMWDHCAGTPWPRPAVGDGAGGSGVLEPSGESVAVSTSRRQPKTLGCTACRPPTK